MRLELTLAVLLVKLANYNPTRGTDGLPEVIKSYYYNTNFKNNIFKELGP